MRIFLVILFALCFAWFCLADQESFSHYQIIIDRHPFGEGVTASVEDKEVPSNESFAKNMRLTMIYESGGDIRVGLVDDSKNNKSYILKINGSVDGFELIGASIKNAEARLKKGSEVALLKLETNTYQFLDPHQKEPRPKASTTSRLEKEEHPQLQLTAEELRARMEAVQMDAIRTGKPPLPLPLTREMDEQLIREGILDPQ